LDKEDEEVVVAELVVVAPVVVLLVLVELVGSGTSQVLDIFTLAQFQIMVM
jgi:hypothetical protein